MDLTHIADVDTPTLLIDWDIAERNVAEMAVHARANGVSLRPHAKTHKMREFAELQLQHGAVGLTLAKLGEVESLLVPDLRDVLVAYPIVGAEKIARLLALGRQLRVAIALDHADVARQVGEVASAAGATVDVLIEIDSGARRCGALPGQDALDLANTVASTPGLHLRGIMTHEGHAYAATSRTELRRVSQEAGAIMVQVARDLRAAGHELELVSVGSTPSARDIAEVSGISEVRPGTYIFNDYNMIRLGIATEDDCAASILATVVARPAPDRAVIDAGSKAVGSDRHMIRVDKEGYGVVKGQPGWFFARCSEEHGVLLRDDAGPADDLRVGDRVEVVPNHICPAVNLHDEAVIVRDGRAERRLAVAARGRIR
jgi:D-serine deaminase-like pyridoxal phosphate-dependent protein